MGNWIMSLIYSSHLVPSTSVKVLLIQAGKNKRDWHPVLQLNPVLNQLVGCICIQPSLFVPCDFNLTGPVGYTSAVF